MTCLMILAFMMEILTLAPQYATFGTQTFPENSSQKGAPCKLDLVSGQQNNICVMSKISELSNRISISLPFFSTIFYIANWLLIVIMAFSILFWSFKQEEIEEIDKDEEDDTGETGKLLREDKYDISV
jgi:hypothetical protein